jgi:hypothetical protein
MSMRCGGQGNDGPSVDRIHPFLPLGMGVLEWWGKRRYIKESWKKIIIHISNTVFLVDL